MVKTFFANWCIVKTATTKTFKTFYDVFKHFAQKKIHRENGYYVNFCVNFRCIGVSAIFMRTSIWNSYLFYPICARRSSVVTRWSLSLKIDSNGFFSLRPTSCVFFRMPKIGVKLQKRKLYKEICVHISKVGMVYHPGRKLGTETVLIKINRATGSIFF